MKIVFAVKELIKRKAVGEFTILDDKDSQVFTHLAVSGSSRSFDHLPMGEYIVKWIDQREHHSADTRKPFELFGFAWFAYIEPQFETERTELGIHPDGNLPGSAGCIVLPFESLETNKACYEILAKGLKDQGKIKLEVINYT
jgi:hypothetical protein